MSTTNNIFAYTEQKPTDGYVGYLSLNENMYGTIELTTRSPGHQGQQSGTVVVPKNVLVDFAKAIQNKYPEEFK